MRRAAVAVQVCWLVLAAAAAAADLQVVGLDPPRHGYAAAITAVSVTFDRAVQPASIGPATFRVFGKTSGVATGVPTLSNGDRTVTLVPARPFSAGEVVLVNLSHDLTGADGFPLRAAGFAWQFRVRTAPATREFVQSDALVARSDPDTIVVVYGSNAADFDGDGWVDLAAVTSWSADVRVFLNAADGTGTFGPFLPPTPTVFNIKSSESADLDGDGIVDLAISSRNGQFWVLRGNGDGSFTTTSLPIPGESRGVAVLDVDGDAALDAVAANIGGARLALMRNDGSGSLSAPTFFAEGPPAEYTLASADMNQDGIMDLVSGGDLIGPEDAITVHLGRGDGTFVPGGTVPIPDFPRGLDVGDVDGDGIIDVASVDGGGGRIFLGNGDGTLDPPSVTVSTMLPAASDLADLDGDDDLDWIIADFGGTWRLFLNDGHGHFALDQEFAASAQPSCATPLDADNDGDLDLALSDELADVVLIELNTAGAPSPCPHTPGTCRTPIQAGKAKLSIDDLPIDRADKLQLAWTKGVATTKTEWGTPTGGDDYHLCVYDAGELVATLAAPAGGGWKESATGFRYKDLTLGLTGTQSVLTKAGGAGKAIIKWKAKGEPLTLPDVDALTGPVDVRIRRDGGDQCWGATFSAPFLKQDAFKLRAASE